MEANKTCRTCKDNDNGLCDRTGQLIDDDDHCGVRHTSSKVEMQIVHNIDKEIIMKSIHHYKQDNQSTVCMQYMTFREKLLMEPKCTMHQKKFMNTFYAAFVQ